MARILLGKIQQSAQNAAKLPDLGRGAVGSDGSVARQPRSGLRAKSGEFREQGARLAVIDTAPHARCHCRHRHGAALVYWPRFDRRAGDRDHRDRHRIFG